MRAAACEFSGRPKRECLALTVPVGSIIARMLIFVVLLGLLASLAINSLADNLPPDELGVRRPPAWPRCRYCGATHAPAYWLASAAFLVRGGRCEHCTAPRRWRHVVVELGTALSLAYVALWAGGDWLKFLSAAVIVVLFILIAVIDIEHRLILRVVIFPSAVIIGLMNSLTPGRGPLKTLLGGLAGYGIWLVIFLAAQVFSAVMGRLRGRPLEEIAFGGGDVNLGGVVGLAVGWSGILLTIPITIFSAAAFSLLYIGVQSARRKYSLFTALPYGPFLILGALVMYLHGREFAAWYFGR